MKVANIIIAHKNPGQLQRLIRQYNPELFHNFVHIDGKCDFSLYRPIAAMPCVTMLPRRRKLVWAGYGFVQVTLDALYSIQKRSEKFFYINLMSGMDFPTRPTQQFYQYLYQWYPQRREYFEILDLSVWPGRHRFELYHLIDWTIKGRYFAEKIINSIISKRKFYGQLEPFGRAAWFTATDEFIQYTLRYLDENPGFNRFLKTVWCPDEFIFNTLIMNSPFKDRVAPHYLRHIDWSEGKASPKTFTRNDLPQLLADDTSFLARKFDESIDSEIIDELERSISTGN